MSDQSLQLSPVCDISVLFLENVAHKSHFVSKENSTMTVEWHDGIDALSNQITVNRGVAYTWSISCYLDPPRARVLVHMNAATDGKGQVHTNAAPDCNGLNLYFPSCFGWMLICM